VYKEEEEAMEGLGLFTTEGLEMPIILYLNKTGVGRNTGIVEAISENG
jgi:hypothetical protein